MRRPADGHSPTSRARPPKVLAQVNPGDYVELVAEGKHLIANSNGIRVGVVEPRVAARLLKMIANGNKYAAGVTSLGAQDVRIIIREVFQDPRNYGKVSFPTAAKSSDLRPYTKGTLLREDEDLEDDLEDDVEDEEIEDLDRVLPAEVTPDEAFEESGRARGAVGRPPAGPSSHSRRTPAPPPRPAAADAAAASADAAAASATGAATGRPRGAALAESSPMTPREIAGRPARPLALPIFERLAPALPPELLAAHVEAASAPDDVVIDLFGRGGWVARTALALGRRAVSIETSPLSRLLADVVVRAPDLRHLDAAFQAVAASPLGATSLRAWIDERFATRCPTCGRTLALEELVWERDPEGTLRPTRRSFRCPPASIAAAGAASCARRPWKRRTSSSRRVPIPIPWPARRSLADSPCPKGRAGSSSSCSTSTRRASWRSSRRSSSASRATSGRRRSRRPCGSPSSTPSSLQPPQRVPGRPSSLRIVAGRIRPPGAPGWRERNPWRAFEDGYRLVRAFVQALDGGPHGAVQARLTEPLEGVLDGPPMISLRVGGGDALERLAAEGAALSPDQRARVRLVLSQPRPEWTPARLAEAFVLTAWALGSEAARLLPHAALESPDVRPEGRGGALGRALEAVSPAMGSRGTAVVLLDPDGAPGLVEAGIAAAAAGWRVASARVAEPGRMPGGVLGGVPPGGRLGAGARTRANLALPTAPGGAGDPGSVAGRGLFGGPVPVDGRFSISELNRVVTETAVRVLQARGEPADEQHLVGELLVALDRSGQLRRFAAGATGPPGGEGAPRGPGAVAGRADIRAEGHRDALPPSAGRAAIDLLALLEAELWRPGQRKVHPRRVAACGWPTRATRPRRQRRSPIGWSGRSSACSGAGRPSPRRPCGPASRSSSSARTPRTPGSSTPA